MPDNNEIKDNENVESAEEDDGKLHISGEKKVSVLENIRKRNEKLRLEELEEESRREAEKAERERIAREAYEKKLAEERLELMKLKAGVISEDDIPKEEKVEKVYTVWEKLGNFFYHEKWPIILVTAITILAIFLVYDYVTNKKPDAAIMIIARDSEFITRAEDIQKLLEPYCEDFNGDGIVYLRVSYLPAVTDTSSDSTELYYSQAEQTKLVAEFQSAESIMVITNDYTTETLGMEENVFADLGEIYPDNENITTYGYLLSGTNLAEDIGYTALSDDLYMAFREPHSGVGINETEFTENYENALKVWNNYLNGNKISEDLPHYSDED